MYPAGIRCVASGTVASFALSTCVLGVSGKRQAEALLCGVTFAASACAHKSGKVARTVHSSCLVIAISHRASETFNVAAVYSVCHASAFSVSR